MKPPTVASNPRRSVMSNNLGDIASVGGPGGVAAVDRAVSILACFQVEEISLSLAEIAQRTGIYKSTILRIMHSLLRARLVLRLVDGRYRIGPEALRLGTIYRHSFNVGDVVLPVMTELAKQTSESVVFYVREGNARVALHRVESQQAIRFHVREGDTLPLSAGSGGRVLLAFSGTPGEPYQTIRRKMYCAVFGERNPETAGVSVPVFGPHMTLAGALTIAGPTSRIHQHFVRRHLHKLFLVAARISSDLGASSDAVESLLKHKQTRIQAVPEIAR